MHRMLYNRQYKYIAKINSIRLQGARNVTGGLLGVIKKETKAKYERAMKLCDEGMSIREASEAIGLGKSTAFYQYRMKRLKKKSLAPLQPKTVEPLRATRPPKVTQYIVEDTKDDRMNIVVLSGNASAIERVMQSLVSLLGVRNG